MNTQYEAVLKFLRNEDFAEAADWLDVVQRSPGFLQWWGALELVAKIALTVAAIVLLGWLWERSQLWWLERQRTSLSNSSGTAPRRPRTFGLVGKWIRILATQPQSGRSGGAETLGTLVARRYDWAGSVFGLLRNAALMIGLLFTFIGLGLTLHQLSGALDLDQNVANVNEALRGVRSALPGLSTAFGSSVFGVLVALGIWIVDTLMQMLRNDIEAELKSRSVAWLEAHFSPLTAEKGFEQLVVELSTLNRLMTNPAAAATDDAKNHDFIRETLGSLAEASNTLNSSTDRLAKAADNLLFVVNRNLDVEKGQNEAAMAAREAAAEMRKTQVGLTQAAQEVGGVLEAEGTRLNAIQYSISSLLTRFDKTVQSLQDATATHGEHYSVVLAEMHAHLGRLNGVTQAFALTGALLDRNASALAQNATILSEQLQVSGAHVAALAEAADSFREAQEHTKSAIERSIFEQNDLIDKVAVTFRQIPEMTEAITKVVANTNRALAGLSEVLTGDDLSRYLEKLPQLVKLSQAEAQSREVLLSAVTAFQGVMETIDTLDANVRSIGQSTLAFERSIGTQNKNIEASVRGLIIGVSEAAQKGIAGPIRIVVEAAMEPQRASIQALKAEVEALGQHTSALNEELRNSVRELSELRAENSDWRHRPRGLGAFFGRRKLGGG